MEFVIAFDVDEVIIDIGQELFNFFNKKFNSNFSKEDFIEFDFHSTYAITKEQTIEYLLEFYQTDKFQNIVPRADALEYLPKIKSLGPDIRIDLITSRFGDDAKKAAYNMINDYFSDDIRQIHFAEHSNSDYGRKHQILSSIGARVFVDDHLLNVADASGICEFVFLMDQPWNRDAGVIHKYFPDGFPDNVEVIHSLQDAYHKIEKIYNSKL